MLQLDITISVLSFDTDTAITKCSNTNAPALVLFVLLKKVTILS